MHPQSPAGRRPTARISVLSLCIGAALAAAPMALPVRAQEAPTYGRLPILERDWTRLPVGRDGVDPVAAEQRRQAEVTRRWHLVHDLVGGAHVSQRSRASWVPGAWVPPCWASMRTRRPPTTASTP